MVSVPRFDFPDGHHCPQVGLGTWQLKSIEDVITKAISVGYRYFDCAFGYRNQKEIGAAFKSNFQNGSIKREDIFVTSKVWMTCTRPGKVLESCKETLNDLQLSYLDLYLIHWPISLQEGDDLFPTDSNGQPIYSTTDYVDTWKAMQSLVDMGLTRSIGVCNFNIKQLQRLLSLNLPHPISSLQIEVTPYLPNKKLIEFAEANNITVTAYVSLGGPQGQNPDNPVLMKEPIVTEIAAKHNRTPAQILLRWGIQSGCAVIPKTATFQRLTENLSVFDFALTDNEMKRLDSLNRNFRFVAEKPCRTSEHYPFHDEA